MRQWRQLWKDILLTGTGLFVIVLQALSSHPNGLLLGTGLALTVPSTWDHIKALIPTSGDGSSSSSSESGGSLPPPSSPEEVSGGER